MTQVITQALMEAGKLFRNGFYGAKEIRHKGRADLVTQFDLSIEEMLIEHLQSNLPDFTIIAEESASDALRHDKVIYIDPIDGTTNFVHKIPFCAISIGVWEEQKPIFGAVYNPILNEFFTAHRNKGAFLDGQPICVRQTTQLQEALIATGFPYTKVEKGRDYSWVIASMQRLLPHTRDIRRLGSASIDLAYVAAGIYDGFYECNLKPWDVAAGILLIEEAGGRVSNHLGEPYRLGDPIIVASNGPIHQSLLEHLAPY